MNSKPTPPTSTTPGLFDQLAGAALAAFGLLVALLIVGTAFSPSTPRSPGEEAKYQESARNRNAEQELARDRKRQAELDRETIKNENPSERHRRLEREQEAAYNAETSRVRAEQEAAKKAAALAPPIRDARTPEEIAAYEHEIRLKRIELGLNMETGSSAPSPLQESLKRIEAHRDKVVARAREIEAERAAAEFEAQAQRAADQLQGSFMVERLKRERGNK